MLIELLYECLSDSGYILIQCIPQWIYHFGYGNSEFGFISIGA